MPDAVFIPAGEGRFIAGELARGPWDPEAQHGGAPAALLMRAFERLPGGPELVLARVTYELLRPVPLGELEVQAEVARAGRRVQVLEGALWAEGVEVVRARGLRVMRAEVAGAGGSRAGATSREGAGSGVSSAGSAGADARGSVGVGPAGAGAGDSVGVGPAGADAGDSAGIGPAGADAGDSDVPAFPPGAGEANDYPSRGQRMFATDAMDIRFTSGSFLEPGPASAWFRLRHPLVSGESTSPLQRVAAAADFGNGISAMLPWDRYIFINPDLTLYLDRPPVGEWFLLEAVTRLGEDGIGVSESVISDPRGPLGRAIQSLLVARRGG